MKTLALGISVAAVMFVTAPSAARHRSDKLERLVEQLGHPRYELRQAAEADLVRIGVPAVEILRDAMDHRLPEIRHRARSALQEITSLTPKQQVAKRTQGRQAFKAGDFETMQQIYAHLAMADGAMHQDLMWLGHAHQLMDDWTGAVRAYERALHARDRAQANLLTIQLEKELQRQQKEQAAAQRAPGADARAVQRKKVLQKQIHNQNAAYVRRRASLRLLIGRVQRDVLNDLPAAARSFADGARRLKGSSEPISDLMAQHIGQIADPYPIPPNAHLLYPLTVMRELAETRVRLGLIDEAIEAWNRHNLIGQFNAANPSIEIHAIARLAAQRDASAPMPPIASIVVMSEEHARVVLDLDDAATEARAYEVTRSSSRHQWRFALLPATGLEFDSIQVECEFERQQPNDDGRVRFWGVAGPNGKRHVPIGDVAWPAGAGDGRKLHTERFGVPAGLDVVHLESRQRDETFNVHRVTVSATFRPRIPHVEPKDTWSNVMIETLPADGMLKRNGERVVHSGTMVLDAGSYEFRYEAPGHRREFQTRLSIEAGQTYGLLINLDNPFGARLTDLRRFGRAHSADANLVRLPDGRWLVAFCRDYKNIMVSTSDNLVQWDEPWRLPFNKVCQTIAPALFVDDDATVWLAYFSNRLHLESTSTGGYRLWLTHTRDGRKWSRPKPVHTGTFGGWPAGSVRITRHPNGAYWMFWRDLAGSATSLDKLTHLANLGFKRKHKLDVRSPHVTIEQDGLFHMVFTNRRHEIQYCRSTDGKKWTDPAKLVENPRVVADAQLFLSAGRAALMYETQEGSFLRRGAMQDTPVLGERVKIAHGHAPLFGSKAHLTQEGEMLLLAGHDTVWLMRASMEDVLGREK